MNLIDALRRQLGRNSRANLLHPDITRLLEIDPIFLAALEEALALPEPNVQARDLAKVAASALIDRVYITNQFIQISSQAKETLEGTYLRTWEHLIETKDIESCLRNFHYPRLAEWIGELYPESLKRDLAFNAQIGQVSCQNYSAELQLGLLKLDPDKLEQPVLDVGCGRSAYLVEHLREKHISAYGLDRSVEAGKEYLKEGNWLETAFEDCKWGTVLSHLAFSNHFAFVEKFHVDQTPIYVAKYQEILRSLKPGGSFIYAPSSLTLEQTVDRSQYSIERFPIGNGYAVTKVLKFAS